jgi:hypothetical protein
MTLSQFLIWLTTHTCEVLKSFPDPVTHQAAWAFRGSCLDAIQYGWQLHLPVVLWP